jgi:hypothetical protein
MPPSTTSQSCLYIEELHDMRLIDVRGQCLRCCLGIEKHERRSSSMFTIPGSSGSGNGSHIAGLPGSSSSIFIRWEAQPSMATGNILLMLPLIKYD